MGTKSEICYIPLRDHLRIVAFQKKYLHQPSYHSQNSSSSLKVKIVVKYTVLDNSRFESNDKLGRVTTNSKDPYLHSELALVSS